MIKLRNYDSYYREKQEEQVSEVTSLDLNFFEMTCENGQVKRIEL